MLRDCYRIINRALVLLLRQCINLPQKLKPVSKIECLEIKNKKLRGKLIISSWMSRLLYQFLCTRFSDNDDSHLCSVRKISRLNGSEVSSRTFWSRVYQRGILRKSVDL